jgi:uncharacterized membrane protein YhiD involved in acid resistance
MTVWIAIGIALLVCAIVASISGQGRITLNLLCILESAEERIRRKRRQTTKVVSGTQFRQQDFEMKIRQHLPELTRSKVDVPPCVVVEKSATQLRARSAFRA